MNTIVAARWATTCLAALHTEHPYEAAHRSLSPEDCDVTPAVLHPSFHGSFDWHSSVHMQWSLVRLIGRHPAAVPPEARALLATRLRPESIAVEVAYLREHRGYERPYGWGWAARLSAAILTSSDPEVARWRPAARMLCVAIADLATEWLESDPRAIRHGLHQNSGFCLALLRDAYTALGRDDVVDAIDRSARRWFADDVDVPTRFEPSGSDIFSPALSEAALMSRVLPPDEFRVWFDRALPGFGRDDDTLLTPPLVVDTADGAATHWSGLALSRAAQLCEIAEGLEDDRRVLLLSSARRHRGAVGDVITDGDFMSTHWLVSFALLADDALERAGSPT